MSTILVSEKRPRDLHWFHAGPLLFGDWGTSRLYVLGLAFYFTAHASPLYLAAMSVIMVAVAWAYSVICRCFPDGGGVYAAARQISPTLSVIGATLLLCDYIVTAALSVVDGFHYFGLEKGWVVPASIALIGVIGVINWLGAKSAGRFALVIAVAAIALSAVIGLFCLPLAVEGAKTVTTGDASISEPWTRWLNLVRIVLALSGLEAVANMTGLMKQPVAKTARRTIWPVLAEVVLLNLIFGLALNALPALKPMHQPDYVTYEVMQGLKPEQVPEGVQAYRDTAMKSLAAHATGRVLGEKTGNAIGAGAGIVFGLLLFSALNTAVMAMVAVKYAMAYDKELPKPLMKLNYSGVPWVGLVIACVLPAALLLVSSDVKFLGELYAIGVVGAISINVLCCAVNRKLPIGRWERAGMWVLGSFMAVVFVTIVIGKHHAAIFAGVMVSAVLVIRFFVQRRARYLAEARLPEPEVGWLTELQREPLRLDPSKPRIMLAARGRYQAEYAVDLARKRGATLFCIFVRTLRVIDAAPNIVPRIEDDAAAQEALGTAVVLARRYGVPCIPIYVRSPNIVEEILDYTVTYGCDTLIMGKTRRSVFARSVSGDVVAEVASQLPEGVALVTRDATPYTIEVHETAKPAKTGAGNADDEPPAT